MRRLRRDKEKVCDEREVKMKDVVEGEREREETE